MKIPYINTSWSLLELFGFGDYEKRIAHESKFVKTFYNKLYEEFRTNEKLNCPSCYAEFSYSEYPDFHLSQNTKCKSCGKEMMTALNMKKFVDNLKTQDKAIL